MISRLSDVLDHAGPVLGGVASWVHCVLRSDRMARWLRDNPEHEPEHFGG